MLALGAEAKITRKGSIVVKDRIKKSYRNPELDYRLRKIRTQREAKLLSAGRRSGVNTPQVQEVSEHGIVMEYIQGDMVKKAFSSMTSNERRVVCDKMGEAIARLHKANIIHGDLTTSNMILREGDLFLIDFGLGDFSESTEDKATDLHLLKQVFDTTHYEHSDAWKHVLSAYENQGDMQVVRQLREIEKRGRYKTR